MTNHMIIHFSYGGGPIRRSRCHPRRVKMSLFIVSSCAHTSVKRSRNSTRCNEDHERSKLVHRYITCKREIFLSLQTLSFLQSQSDQITAIAPTLIIVRNLWSIPCNQLPKIFATECGRYKFEPTWMVDQIYRATLYSKKRCFIVLSCRQKTHFVLPCQLRLTRLSLVRIAPDEHTM